MSFKINRRRVPKKRTTNKSLTTSSSRSSPPPLPSQSSSPPKRSDRSMPSPPSVLPSPPLQEVSQAWKSMSGVVVSTPASSFVFGPSASRGRPLGPRSDASVPQSHDASPSPSHSPPASDPETRVEESFYQLYTDDVPDPNYDSTFRASKRSKQWQTWASQTIPSMLQPYLTLLRESQSLCNIDRNPVAVSCTCDGASMRTIQVTCVFFECTCPLTNHL